MRVFIPSVPKIKLTLKSTGALMINYSPIHLLTAYWIACTSNAIYAENIFDTDIHQNERVFLQQLSSNSVIIKWRGDADEVCYGQNKNSLMPSKKSISITEGNHKEISLTGLKENTIYYYSIRGCQTSSPRSYFRTAPSFNELPPSGITRAWIVGDSGSATDNAKRVRDGFVRYNKGLHTDLFLMLGDNAYKEGSDRQYQKAVFDIYTTILTTTPVWGTIGNHEMGIGTVNYNNELITMAGASTSNNANSWLSTLGSAVQRMPYLDIFSFPTKGQLGGVPSHTEQYYSFNYGNLHVVSLDSQVAARGIASRTAMKEWLIDDLSSNKTDWTIVMFHHPPYSKGSHDSDKSIMGVDQPIFYMREEFVPIFDTYNVDLVYSGHSHNYERSFYIKNHTKLSDQFSIKIHAELNEGGQAASGRHAEHYQQVTGSGHDDKVVYTVLGSSGSVPQPFNMPLDHPAHYVGIPELGSVVLDVSRSELNAKFINVNGEVKDYFTMKR